MVLLLMKIEPLTLEQLAKMPLEEKASRVIAIAEARNFQKPTIDTIREEWKTPGNEQYLDKFLMNPMKMSPVSLSWLLLGD